MAGWLRETMKYIFMLRSSPPHTNMAEFPAGGGCPCTDEKQFPELPDCARPCEFELQLGVFSDHWSFCSV